MNDSISTVITNILSFNPRGRFDCRTKAWRSYKQLTENHTVSICWSVNSKRGLIPKLELHNDNSLLNELKKLPDFPTSLAPL